MGFGLSSGGGGTGGYLDVANFCCPEYLATMRELIKRNWNSRSSRRAGTTHRCDSSIQQRRPHRRRRGRAVERRPALDFVAQRALLLTDSCRRCRRRITEPSLTVHLISSTRVMTRHDDYSLCAASRWRSSLRRGVAARSRRRRRSRRQRRSSRRASSCDLTGDPGTPPRFAVPDFLALSTDRETQEAAQDASAGAVGRSELRARVLHDSARHLQVDSRRRASIDDVPFDRWRELGADGVVIGTVQKTGDRHPRRDAAVQRARRGSQVFGREYTRLGGQPAALRAHDGRRDPQSQRRCAAWRAPS